MNERELALREKAQEFLNQKARVKHYRISGFFNEEYGDGDTWAIFEYTDEEVARLKHLFSEALVPASMSSTSPPGSVTHAASACPTSMKWTTAEV